ncbi:hypothetical protein SSX86_000758 [Deinandra increscens subsp. villosa]|uniref:Uncharacterized protein n=1 Tax=Deinandra increscens subsp. villosa TaxID=3103831 RepID=A0AAP0DXS7_9ASTR
MAIKSSLYLLTFMLLFTLSVSSDPAGTSPAPSPVPVPQLGSDDSPPLGSPPSPPPASDLSPSPVLSPSADDSKAPTPSLSPSLSPAPEAADAGHLSSANVKSEELNKSSSGGMSGGKKAGIAIGVIAAACVVGFGGLLYKKRQQNIRRAEFSSAARREFL